MPQSLEEKRAKQKEYREKARKKRENRLFYDICINARELQSKYAWTFTEVLSIVAGVLKCSKKDLQKMVDHYKE